MRRRHKEVGALRRRDVLIGAGSLAAGGTLSFPAPAIAQGTRQLKMVTDWPAGSPGLNPSAARLAQRIATASAGRINIEVFPSGTLVRPFETFDAVGAGIADMYHSVEYYWEKKSPAFNFFAAVPFGFTAVEQFAWVQYGGGQELWDALSGQFNIKPFLCLNTGAQMGGWCTLSPWNRHFLHQKCLGPVIPDTLDSSFVRASFDHLVGAGEQHGPQRKSGESMELA